MSGRTSEAMAAIGREPRRLSGPAEYSGTPPFSDGIVRMLTSVQKMSSSAGTGAEKQRPPLRRSGERRVRAGRRLRRADKDFPASYVFSEEHGIEGPPPTFRYRSRRGGQRGDFLQQISYGAALSARKAQGAAIRTCRAGAGAVRPSRGRCRNRRPVPRARAYE